MEVARALRVHSDALSRARETLEELRCPAVGCPALARLTLTIHHLRTLSQVIQAEHEIGSAPSSSQEGRDEQCQCHRNQT